MADDDYNTVRPIEVLQNVLGVAPTEQQKEQQRRKGAPKDRQQHSPPASDDPTKAAVPENNCDSDHLIDYRA